MEALGATIFVGLGVLGRGTVQWTSTEAIIPSNKVALDEPGSQVVGFRKTKTHQRLPRQLRFLKSANTNLAEH